jgi:energy-coupling factor transporter ATP-binding protein EcfA2
MEITKVSLRNIRCFEELDIDMGNSHGAKKWMVILGDNGVGKTTVLRSIALGLCEQSGASALLAELAGDWIRSDTPKGTIKIELKPYKEFKGSAYIETTLERVAYGEIKLEQRLSPENPKDFSWEKLFVCAYGAGRGVFGTTDLSEYAVTDSVYSLFNYKSDLQNPELNLRRIESETKDIRPILRKLEKILMVNDGAIELTKSGISINGAWGKSMPTGTLSDGYRGTLTWLLDMYGWKLLFDEHMSDSEVDGIVLIDELEQHLHPKWQQQIITLLSEQFPKIQFIISTHSPLCVIGTTDLNDDECNISVLMQDLNSVVIKTAKPPRGKRADQVLTSYLFDLYTSSDNEIAEEIGRYTRLYNKKERTKQEELELETLRAKLNDELGSPETDLQKLVESAVNNALISLTNDSLEKLKESPAGLEIKRQLQKLFKPND